MAPGHPMQSVAAALCLLLAACGAPAGTGGDSDPGPDQIPTDGGMEDLVADPGPEDTDEPDLIAADVVDGSETDLAIGDAVGDVDDGAQTALLRYFEQENTGLSSDFVFKGGWAGEAGRVVAVGNDGVVASRDPEGDWRVINEGGGSDLLNAVDGVHSGDLWAVGMAGAILHGSVDALGEDVPCVDDPECDNGDTCSVGTCLDGTCVQSAVGGAGCCGSQVSSSDFGDATMSGWTVTQSKGGLTWQTFSYVDMASGKPRYTSPPSAMYFGDPTKTPPNFSVDGDLPVNASVTSPFIELPSMGSASVTFQIFMDAEGDANYDKLSLLVQAGGGGAEIWNKTMIPMIPSADFTLATADLSSWMGKSVQLTFAFDSVDGLFNDGEGIYIDDVVVDTSCEGAESTNFGFPTLFGVDMITEVLGYAVGLGGAIVTYDGLTWKEAGGHDASVTWMGMFGHGDTMVFVGTGGTISIAGGGGLSPVESPTNVTLRDVHSADGDVFWAVGDGGVLLKGQGSSWAQVGMPTSANLYKVYAHGPADAYAVGDGGTVVHYDGVSWSLVTGLPGTIASVNFRAVWVASDGTATITGEKGVMLQGTAEGGFLYLGSLLDDGYLNDIWADDTAMVAVGDLSEVYRLEASWENQNTPTTQHLRSVWGVAADDIWAAGWAGALIHWDGLAWTQYASPMTGQIEVLWGSATDDVYAAGASGGIMHWNGSFWAMTVSQTDRNLRAVFGFPGGDTWAVGAYGTIMRHNGFAWHQTKITPIVYSDGTEEDIIDQLHAVWGATEDDVWAAGSAGRFVHWDGEAWYDAKIEFGITIRGMWGQAADDIWAVGNEGFIAHYDGESWQPWPSGSVATLYDIHGDGQGHVVIVGDLGTVLALHEEIITLEE